MKLGKFFSSYGSLVTVGLIASGALIAPACGGNTDGGTPGGGGGRSGGNGGNPDNGGNSNNGGAGSTSNGGSPDNGGGGSTSSGGGGSTGGGGNSSRGGGGSTGSGGSTSHGGGGSTGSGGSVAVGGNPPLHEIAGSNAACDACGVKNCKKYLDQAKYGMSTMAGDAADVATSIIDCIRKSNCSGGTKTTGMPCFTYPSSGTCAAEINGSKWGHTITANPGSAQANDYGCCQFNNGACMYADQVKTPLNLCVPECTK